MLLKRFQSWSVRWLARSLELMRSNVSEEPTWGPNCSGWGVCTQNGGEGHPSPEPGSKLGSPRPSITSTWFMGPPYCPVLKSPPSSPLGFMAPPIAQLTEITSSSGIHAPPTAQLTEIPFILSVVAP